MAQEDPELLARKAASLDMQRNRFRRALGGEEDEDEAPPDMPVSVHCTSALVLCSVLAVCACTETSARSCAHSCWVAS